MTTTRTTGGRTSTAGGGELPGGVVHALPADRRDALAGDSAADAARAAITPSARNER